MRYMHTVYKSIFTALFVTGGCGFSGLAKADLVLDGDSRGAAGTDQVAIPRAQDRESMRQVLNSSEKARATASSQYSQTPRSGSGSGSGSQSVGSLASAPSAISLVQTQNIEAAPLYQQQQQSQSGAGNDVEVQNLSKTELMRRERVREEVKNEDILQERLEELRLRDEKRRTDQLLGAQAPQAGQAGQSYSPQSFGNDAALQAPMPPNAQAAGQAGIQTMAVTQEAVGAPVNEKSGHGLGSQSLETDVKAYGNGSSSSSEDRTIFIVTPRGGMSVMTSAEFIKVSPKYSAGVALGVGATENIVFELGYTYSEFGVSSTYYSAYPGAYSNQGINTNPDPLSMKQNVADANLKFYLVGSESKFRPFVGAGAAYSKSYVNYNDQRLIDYFNYYGRKDLTQDYEISSFLGQVSAGFDVRVSKNISVGAMFRYNAVLSSNENHALPYAGFYGAAPYQYGANNLSADQDKQIAGGSLSRSSFYSILAGLSFTL